MRILQIESPNPGKEGDHVYRTRQPCRALGALAGVEVASGSWLSPDVHDAVARADVLVLCDVVDPDLMAVVEARARAHHLTVYEINDHFLAPQAWNPTAYLAQNPLLRSLSSQLAHRAHALQVSVPELGREFAHLKDEPLRAVFANQLWEVPALQERGRGDRLWLGWGGSLGHLEDVKWVLPTLRAALDRHPQLGLSIMAPEALRPLFADVPRERLRFTPGGPLERYYQFLAGLDLGVCPLLPTDFNRCRSDVKFLELSAAGVPALCSDLAPYRDSVRSGDNGFIFRWLDELGAQIDQLVNDPALRARIARTAHDDVADGRREEPHAGTRLGRYQDWQAAVGASNAAGGPLAPTRATRPYAGSSYAVLGQDECERLLREGLGHAVAGATAAALAAFRRAEKLAPRFYLPRLYRGAIEPKLGEALAALTAAQSLAPASANVALQRGLRLEAAGQAEKAAAAFTACSALAPGLGAADAHLGALADAAGRTEEAVAFYERAYAANPYFAPSVLRLGNAALGARDVGRATALLENALVADPGVWRFHFLLARAYGEANRWQAAQHHLELARATSDEPAPVLALLAKSQIALGNVAAAQTTIAELRRLVPGGAPAARAL